MYNRRKKDQRKKIILISLFIVCLIIGFVVNVVTTERKLTVFEKAIKDSVITVENILGYPIEIFNKMIHENKIKNEIYSDYEKIKDKLELIDEITMKNTELEKQLQDLKKVLNINTTLSEYTTINATVINRNLSYWDNTILIDKGEDSGILIGMPVIVSEGLIGKVIKTTSFTSTIRLLTANNSYDRISVKIKNGEEYVYGILNGYNEENDTYTIEGISENLEIEIGSVVTTTGMGDIFPSGIVIGKITGVNTDVFDLSNILEMKSDVNFNGINYVVVLKRGLND